MVNKVEVTNYHDKSFFISAILLISLAYMGYSGYNAIKALSSDDCTVTEILLKDGNKKIIKECN